MDSFISKNDKISLILFSLSVALACLDRYVGVTLIIWGALIIVIFLRGPLRGKIAHLSIFLLISTLPLGIWLIRNSIVAGTFTGREPPHFSFFQNLILVSQGIIPWYLPRIIRENGLFLISASLAVGFFVGIGFRNSWPDMKVLRRKNPSILFCITSGLFSVIFVLFVVTVSTFTDCLSIHTIQNSRTLAPIYIPLTLLLLVIVQMLITEYPERFSLKISPSVLLTCLMMWLVYPISANAFNAVNLIHEAKRFTSQAWRESETIHYLLQHQHLKSECKIYSNDVFSTFILAHLYAEGAVERVDYGSRNVSILRLRGFWPSEEKACLVWYNHSSESNYLTFDELREVANIQLIIQLNDGAIYLMSRR